MTLNIVERPAATVVGLQIRTLPMSPDIPALWPRFVARIGEIANPAETAVTYGVMQSREGGLDYLAAIAVTSADAVPPGMTVQILPAGAYACFSYPLSGLAAGFAEIHERLLPASGHVQRPGPSFERYGADFCPDDPASLVEIWLPVAPKA